MRKSNSTQAHMLAIVRQAEAGVPVAKLRRTPGQRGQRGHTKPRPQSIS
jgi:hypothetical protein